MADQTDNRIRVARHWTLAQRIDHYTSKGDDCWLWTAHKDREGYGKVKWPRYGGHNLAHRLAWIAANGPIPAGQHVCHKCDNPSCVRPSHLFLGSDADNAADREKKGRGNQPKGERHNKAKLTTEQVREIRSLKGRLRGAEVAKRYGVVYGTIWWIWKGDHWKSLD